MLFPVTKNSGYPKSDMTKDEFNRLTGKLLEIEEFKHLTDTMFRCLVLYADYRSPFRQKPSKERFRLAAIEAGCSVDSHHHNQLEKRVREWIDGKNKYWNAALKRYMEMQHDEDRVALAAIDAQIANVYKMLEKETDDIAELEKRGKVLKTLPEMLRTKREIAQVAGREEELVGAADETPDVEKSLIDEDNEQRYNEDV